MQATQYTSIKVNKRYVFTIQGKTTKKAANAAFLSLLSNSDITLISSALSISSVWDQLPICGSG